MVVNSIEHLLSTRQCAKLWGCDAEENKGPAPHAVYVLVEDMDSELANTDLPDNSDWKV